MKLYWMSRWVTGILSKLCCVILLAGIDLSAAPSFAGERSVVELNAEQIRHGLATGEYTAETLTRDFLDRIRRYEPEYNAMTSMNPHALNEAREIDRRLAAKERVGSLAGVPIVIKEAVDVAGLPSTLGWQPLSKAHGGIDLVPQIDAPIVRRLREAGAIILGKTNIPAFSADGTRADTSWAGPTYNALDRRLAPGASSSGTATAVAASFAVMGIAEETGGSIQNPAAAQSLVAIKPTFGLVPNSGVAPLAGSTRDVVGVHAKTVRDAAVMLGVIAGYSYEDPKTVAAVGHVPPEGYDAGLSISALQGKRIGLYGAGWRRMPLSAETNALYEQAIAEMVSLGAEIVRDPFADTEFADLAKIHAERSDLRGLESIVQDMNGYFARYGADSPIRSFQDLVAKTGKDPFAAGEPLNFIAPVVPAGASGGDAEPNLGEFVEVRRRYLQIFDRVMAVHELDGLVFPQMIEEVPQLESKDRYNATTVSEINIAGLPGVVVPAGAFLSGSPFGLIFVGPHWSEAKLLSMAYAFEQGRQRRIVPRLTFSTP